MYVAVRADGDWRAAGDGQRRTDGQVVGILDALTLAATLSPLANGGSRDLLGLGLGSTWTREHDDLHVHAAGALSGRRGRRSDKAPARGSRRRSCAVYFTWGQIYSLFPSTSGDYFGTKHATSNYAVLYTAKGVASIIGGWVGALLSEQSGSWAMGFYGSAVMALIAAGWPSAARRRRPRRRPATARMPGARRDRYRHALARSWSPRTRTPERHVVSPPSARDAGFDLAAAYAVEAELVRLRRAAGRTTVGRKVGYANKAVWRVLKLDTLVWAHMYDDTVRYADRQRRDAVAGAHDARRRSSRRLSSR